MPAADFWDEAMPYDTYLGQMRDKRDQHVARLQATAITAGERAAFAGEPLRFLVLTEDYCGDSAQFIPPVAKLAEELDNVELRILLRNEHRELADAYRRWDGYQAIPVFIILDQHGHELGFLSERPRRLYDVLAAETRRFAQAHPELDGINRTYANMPEATRAEVLANADRFRAEHDAEWTRVLFEDFAALVGEGRELSGSGSGAARLSS
jgi:hypothetical protein